MTPPAERAIATTAAEGVPAAARPSRWRALARATRAGLPVLLVASAILFALVSNSIVERFARPYLYRSTALVPGGRDVAIVPGASVHRDGTPSPQLQERLAAALELLRSGRVRTVLVSGAHRGAYDEAGPMRRWLVQHGAAGSAVLEDHSGFRTLDTMERAAKIFRVSGAIVCTQSFHLPRAVFLARRAGIDALGVAADPLVRTTGPSDSIREWFARVMAVLDSYVLHRGPREASLFRSRRGGSRHLAIV